MRALSGGIPRGFRGHRSHDGREYRAYCRSFIAQHGQLPAYATPTLREAGRCSVELGRLGLALDDALTRRRRRDAARIRRQLVTLRSQLVNRERRLEEVAKTRPGSFAAAATRAARGEPRPGGTP